MKLLCQHTRIAAEPFDFGTCFETGYRDSGERFTCRDCGEELELPERKLVASERILRERAA